MATIHMVLQGKGGVGKSMLAAMLTQFKISKGQKPICFDTDPVNRTFERYQSLNVQGLDVMEGTKVNARNFDRLIEQISGVTDDVIIDNGASTFIPLSAYLISNGIPELLQEMGHQLFVHTVITGGQAMPDTLGGFDALVNQFPPESRFVVWLNPYWGKVENKGMGFEQMKLYKDNAEKVIRIVSIPEFEPDTFGHDLSNMLKARHTFDEVIDDVSLGAVVRNRFKIMQRQVFGELGKDPAQVLLYGY